MTSKDLARERRTTIVAITVLLITLAIFAWPATRLAVTPMDEGSLLVYPTLVLQGKEPNRDFETFYGPGNLWVLAGAFALAGPSVYVERFMGWLYRAGMVIATFLLARRKGLLVGLACGVLSAGLLVVLGLLAYAWLGGLAFALFSLYVAAEGRAWFIAGLLGAGAILFRPDLAISILVIGLFAARKRRFAAGVAVGLVPFLVHLARVGVATAFQTEVVDLIKASHARHLPLGWAGWMPSIVFLSVGVAILVGVISWRTTGSTVLLMVALFEVGLLPQALQRSDTTHLLMVGCVTMSLIPLFAASIPSMPSASGVVLLAGAVVISIGAVANAPSYAARMKAGFAVENQGRMVYAQSPEEVAAIQELAARINADARAGDKIVVGPADTTRTPYDDTFLYFLFPDLEPGTFYLEMNPTSANGPDSRLAEDLADARFVITTNRYTPWSEPNASMDPGPPDAQHVLDDRFCPVTTRAYWTLLEVCPA